MFAENEKSEGGIMGNLVFCVDKKFLELATWLAKRFCWLTGQDNFVLARIGIIMMVSVLVVADGLAEKLSWKLIPVYGLLGFIWMWEVGDEEKRVSSEALRGTKDFARHLVLATFRMTLFWVSASLLVVALLLVISEGYFGSIFYSPLGALATAIVYLMSVDKPPYSRSMAWKWLKDNARATMGALSPQPELKPAPVHVR